MTISFINQENEEIKKTDWRIYSCKIKGKHMAAKFFSVVSLLRLN